MLFDTREPCLSCPYRKDAAVRLWHRSMFERLLETEQDPIGSVYGCHKFRNRPPEEMQVCAGWLLDQRSRGLPSIMLRIVLMEDEGARVALEHVSSGGHRLYRSVVAMCRANGVRTRTRKEDRG